MIKFAIGKNITTNIHSYELFCVSNVKLIVFIKIKNPINKNNLDISIKSFFLVFCKVYIIDKVPKKKHESCIKL